MARNELNVHLRDALDDVTRLIVNHPQQDFDRRLARYLSTTKESIQLSSKYEVSLVVFGNFCKSYLAVLSGSANLTF